MNDKTKKNKKKAIALLCKTPPKEHIDFLKQLNHNYDIYFICDQDISKLNLPNINNIHYIYYNDAFVAEKGYHDSCIYIKKNKGSHGLVTSWDKALYYFCEVNSTYSHIWFIEEDVFIPLPETIRNIDKKYSNKYDLLVQDNFIYNYIGIKRDITSWIKVKETYDILNLPWYKSMQCANRVSKKLLVKIKDIVKKYKTLVYHEYMFNTLAHMNNLNVKVIDELKYIEYRHNNKTNWNYNEIIDFTKLYHPIKDMKLQKVYHELIAKKDKIS
uniref:Uncharacterized protein n=1 Tax=viral metagenome TaxID=1070528 RepID=A0A6C0D8N5_9ZZZZ